MASIIKSTVFGSSDSLSIQLPDVSGYTSKVFELKTNPHWQEAETQSYARLDNYGLYTGAKREKFFGAGFGLMTALCYPDADLERLSTTTDFVLWLFSFDDMADEGEFKEDVEGVKTAIDTMINVLRKPDAATPDLIIAAFLQKFFARMRSVSSLETTERMINAFYTYTQATLQQTTNRSVDKIPSIDEYIQIRRDTSAVKIGFAVLEYSLGLNFPDAVFEDPAMAELWVAGNDILTWANDIYSFPVELGRGDTHNLVFVAMQEKQLTLEGAMDYVNELTRARLNDYVEAKKQLRSFGPELDDEIAVYVRGMEHLVQGSIDWSFMTPRYFGDKAQQVRETGLVEITVPSIPIAV